MALLTHVVAMARNHIIGNKGELPWHIPGELKHFKALTINKPVIMGRKTWQSLPIQPLPQRLNIVITRQKTITTEGVRIFNDLHNAIQTAQIHAHQKGVDEIAIIGGGELFTITMEIVDRLYITEIEEDFEGDVTYPKINMNLWLLTDKKQGPMTLSGATTHYCCYDKR